MENSLAPFKYILGHGFLGLVCILPFIVTAAGLDEQELSVTPKGVQIQITERALGEALRDIEDASGIRFSFSTAIGTVPITAAIQATDWPSAIRELLQSFSTAEVWQKKQLSRVYILERGATATVSELPPATSVPLIPPPPPPLDAGGSMSESGRK